MKQLHEVHANNIVISVEAGRYQSSKHVLIELLTHDHAMLNSDDSLKAFENIIGKGKNAYN